MSVLTCECCGKVWVATVHNRFCHVCSGEETQTILVGDRQPTHRSNECLYIKNLPGPKAVEILHRIFGVKV